MAEHHMINGQHIINVYFYLFRDLFELRDKYYYIEYTPAILIKMGIRSLFQKWC